MTNLTQEAKGKIFGALENWIKGRIFCFLLPQYLLPQTHLAGCNRDEHDVVLPTQRSFLSKEAIYWN